MIAVVGVLLLELRLKILGAILKFSSTMFEGKRIKLQEQGVTVGQTMMAPCQLSIRIENCQAKVITVPVRVCSNTPSEPGIGGGFIL